MKTDHSPESLKKIRESHLNEGKKMTQADLAEAINLLFNQESIPDSLGQRQITNLENGNANLSISRGLATAQVLDTCLAALLHRKVLELGSLETKLTQFDSQVKQASYFMKLEEDGRLVVFYNFPSSIYLDVKSASKIFCREYIKIQQHRFRQLCSVHAHSSEFYSIDSLLEFAFSPFSRFANHEKIEILEKVVELFGCHNNHLHFFCEPHHPYKMTNLMLLRAKRLSCMPVQGDLLCLIELYNPILYEKLIKIFLCDYKNKKDTFTSFDESIDLVYRLHAELKTGDTSVKEKIQRIYQGSSSDLQKIMYETVKPFLTPDD